MSVNVRNVEGIAVVELIGRMTLGASANAVRDALALLSEQGHNRIILVLAQVPFVDSAGVGVIADGYRSCVAMGGALKLVQPNAQVVRVLEVSGLGRILQSYVYERDALASFAPEIN